MLDANRAVTLTHFIIRDLDVKSSILRQLLGPFGPFLRKSQKLALGAFEMDQGWTEGLRRVSGGSQKQRYLAVLDKYSSDDIKFLNSKVKS